MEEDLLVMIGRLDEAEVVLECGDEPEQSLGVDGAVEDLDGDGTLQAGPLHFTYAELHLQENSTRYQIQPAQDIARETSTQK